MSRRDSGYALLTALLAIFLLSVALGLLAASLQLRLRATLDDAQRVNLSALADAAVAEALANLARSAGYAGSPARDFGGGRIESRVAPAGPGAFEVVATATYQGRRRTVRAEVQRAPGAARVRRWQRLSG